MPGLILFCFMADNPAFGHVDNIFGNIGCVIGDALQMAGNRQKMNQGLNLFRMLQDALFYQIIHFLIDAINIIVEKSTDVGIIDMSSSRSYSFSPAILLREAES